MKRTVWQIMPWSVSTLCACVIGDLPALMAGCSDAASVLAWRPLRMMALASMRTRLGAVTPSPKRISQTNAKHHGPALMLAHASMDVITNLARQVGSTIMAQQDLAKQRPAFPSSAATLTVFLE